MKRRVRRVKWLSLVLTLTILLGCLPGHVFAVEAGELVSASDAVETTQSEMVEAETLIESSVMIGDEEIGAVAEVASLRTADTKHFRLDNGTYTAVRYGAAVHRQDANGVWQDIDNRLIRNETSDGAVYSTPDSRVTLAAGYAPGAQLLTISENGYTVSLGLMEDTSAGNGSISTEPQPLDKWASPTVVAGAARPASMKYDTIDEAMSFNGSSSITYNEVRANTNLEYQLHGNTVKENIIVSAAADEYEYTFALYLSGLTAVACEDGSIALNDATTGQAKYTIPAPYMYDAIGENSTAVAYELAQVKTGLYLLNVTADPTWINAEERVFPVTIDPSVTTSDSDIVADSYTTYNSSTTNYGSQTTMRVDQTHISYVKIGMPDLPDGATVNNVFMYMMYYYTVSEGSQDIGIYEIAADWDEATITHQNSPSSYYPPINTVTLTAHNYVTSSSPGTARLVITDVAKEWYAGAPNYGVSLELESNTSLTTFFMSSENSDPSNRPFVGVTYTYYVPDGVYALENIANDNYWMRVNGNGLTAGTSVVQGYRATSPADEDVFLRAGLFKISRVPDTDLYIIRSMLNNKLGLGVSGTNVVTKTLPGDDADVADTDKFCIEWLGSGFGIRPYGTTVVLHMTSTSTTNLTTIAKASATTSSQWALEMYAGEDRSGISGYTTAWASNGIVQETATQAQFVGWSTITNANVLSVGVDSGYAHMATASWDADTGMLTLTGYDFGAVRVISVLLNSDTGAVVKQTSYSFTIIPKTGTYYIQNVGTLRYMDVKGPSTAEGAIIHQWQFHIGSAEKWIVEHVSGANGYIRLKSMYSNRYLGVDSQDTSLVKQYSAANDYTLWKIERTTAGNYKLTCKATLSGGNVLSVPLNANANGTNLTQLSYTNNTNYRDEWLLYKINYVAVVNHFYDEGYCVRYLESESASEQNIMGYAQVVAERYVQLFGLALDLGDVQYFNSAIDQCKGNTHILNVNSLCSHGENETIHTDRDSVLADFGQKHPGDSATTNILWSGHLISSTATNGNRNYNRSCSYYNCVYMLTISMLNRTRNSKGVLMHELNHQYGAKDHYHELRDKTDSESCKFKDVCSECGTNSRDDKCIMNNSRIEITPDSVICGECRNDIISKLNAQYVVS